MTTFERALLQAVNEDFSHVPPEEELNCPTLPPRKLPKPKAFRLCLIAAAVSVLLIGGVLAAYSIRYPIGQVKVETDISKILPFEVDEEYANNNRYYNLSFTEELISPNAPDFIETFYLPTYGVGADTLDLPSCCITSPAWGVYRPFANLYFVIAGDGDGVLVSYEDLMPNPSQENIHKILEAPGCAAYEWNTKDGSRLSFEQYPAKRVDDGLGMNYILPSDSSEHPSWETIEIDEYSVFTFNVEYGQNTPDEDPKEQITRFWYWTNGEYLFCLSAACSAEEMTELFRSVKPVSTEYPYEAQSDRIAENFTLPTASAD